MLKSDFSVISPLKKNLSRYAKNPLFGKIFVPSFFIFLILSGTILLGSSLFFDGRINPAGAAVLALAAAVFIPVYRNALEMHGGPGPGQSMLRGNVARAVAVFALAVALSAILCVRLKHILADDDGTPGQGRWTAQVESVMEKRYYREAAISFRRSEDDSAVRRGPFAIYRGLARITGGTVGQGDTIRFSARPVTAGPRGKVISPSDRSLLLKGVRHIFYLDARAVEVVITGSSFREKVRNAIAANCDRMFNRETSAMVKALYFGNQDYIAKTTMNDFKRAGVFHILSAGGVHVGVIAAIPLFLLGIVRVNRRIIMSAAVLAVFMYLYITDAPVCLLRSCIMFFMYTAQRIAGREVNIFNTFFLSGAIILMMFPHEIFGLGFQLSYGATLGILLFHGSYRSTISWLPRFIANPLALTLSAQLLVLPVILVRLSELNLMGLLSNVIVVPLMSLLLVASLAAHALSVIAVLGLWAGRAVNAIYGLGGAIVGYMSGLNGHFFVAAAGPALFAAFLLLVLPLLPRLRTVRFVSFSIGAAVAIAWFSLGAGIRSESITVLRHGAGSLMLVKQGTLLSVAGQVPDRGSADALMGIIAASSPRDVELHITDPDYRNISGYTMLLKRLPVRRCYLSDNFKIRGYSRRFLDILERDGTELIISEYAAAGPAITSGNLYSPDVISRLYRDVSAGAGPSFFKKVEIQYLTLH